MADTIAGQVTKHGNEKHDGQRALREGETRPILPENTDTFTVLDSERIQYNVPDNHTLRWVRDPGKWNGDNVIDRVRDMKRQFPGAQIVTQNDESVTNGDLVLVSYPEQYKTNLQGKLDSIANKYAPDNQEGAKETEDKIKSSDMYRRFRQSLPKDSPTRDIPYQVLVDSKSNEEIESEENYYIGRGVHAEVSKERMEDISKNRKYFCIQKPEGMIKKK